jgi:hypothetical protein
MCNPSLSLTLLGGGRWDGEVTGSARPAEQASLCCCLQWSPGCLSLPQLPPHHNTGLQSSQCNKWNLAYRQKWIWLASLPGSLGKLSFLHMHMLKSEFHLEASIIQRQKDYSWFGDQPQAEDTHWALLHARNCGCDNRWAYVVVRVTEGSTQGAWVWRTQA